MTLIKNKLRKNLNVLNNNKKLMIPDVKYDFLDDKKEILRKF